MLAPGDKAPEFSLPDQAGNLVSLSELGGKSVVVYFYPKADTPGCTTQACSVRDHRVGRTYMGNERTTFVGSPPSRARGLSVEPG